MAESQFVINVGIATCNICDHYPGLPYLVPNIEDDGSCRKNLVSPQWSQTRGLYCFLDDVLVVAVEGVPERHQHKAQTLVDVRAVDHTLKWYCLCRGSNRAPKRRSGKCGRI